MFRKFIFLIGFVSCFCYHIMNFGSNEIYFILNRYVVSKVTKLQRDSIRHALRDCEYVTMNLSRQDFILEQHPRFVDWAEGQYEITIDSNDAERFKELLKFFEQKGKHTNE